MPLWWAVQGSNLRPSACKADALPAELTARVFAVVYGDSENATNKAILMGGSFQHEMARI